MRILMMVAASVVAATTFPTGAFAAAPAAPPQLGLCAACHGATGVASLPGVPHLAAQRVDYLRAALRQYRDGQRNNAPMRAAVGSLSDAQLGALALWYSQQKPAAAGRS